MIVEHVIVSIHTPTQGVTQNGECAVGLVCFNPHTHAGCDPVKPVDDDCPYTVSIHTPTQGVTQAVWEQFTTSWFQSTHPRRV